MKYIKIAVTAIYVALPGLVFSQPPTDEDVLDNPVPFDDGAIALVVIALGLGVRKVFLDKKQIASKKGQF